MNIDISSKEKYDILLINPPFSILENPDYLTKGTFLDYKMECINPGILSIASYVASKGFLVKIIDLSIDKDFEQLISFFKYGTAKIIGVSSTCAYDYLESLHCIELAYENSPESLLMMGGQHAGPLGKIVFDDSKYLDLLCLYEGEDLAVNLINTINSGSFAFEDLKGIIYRQRDTGRIVENREAPYLIPLDEMPVPNFELYPNYLRFTPYVEESRGCPFKCSYCVNSFYDRPARTKSNEIFLRDLDHVISLYGKDRLYAFLAANFGMRGDKTCELLEQLKDRGICWGTEIRVDNPWEKYVDKLYDAGMRTIGIGMESASPEILLRMNKTNNPRKYLTKAINFIKECYQFNLKPSLNIMAYVGETPKTLKETLYFLLSLDEYIYRVDAFSVFEIQGTELSVELDNLKEETGCERVVTPYTQKTHIYPLSVSKYYSYEAMSNYCRFIKDLFSNDEIVDLEEKRWDYREFDFLMKRCQDN